MKAISSKVEIFSWMCCVKYGWRRTAFSNERRAVVSASLLLRLLSWKPGGGTSNGQ
jgi:hypothetical protein